MMFAKSEQSRIWESEKQKLLGVTIKKHLKFEEHIVKQCKKAGEKLCNFNESVYKIPVWILPFNLNVLREKIE